MSYNEVGVFGDNEPEKVEITFSKVDDTFLDKFNKFLERAESRRERYDLTWNGKAAAFAEAGKPLEPAKTLRPDLNESVDFDKTQNLFITGDNLEALKLLQESYLNKVDMIYIDPPYNTGHDFIYHDNFHRSQSDEIDDSRDDDGDRQYVVNSKENGRYHSDWLSMMYPRLIVARNLLASTGVIFVSIDSSESANLRLICDEVFGADNFIGDIAWRRFNSQANIGMFAKVRDSVLVYAKDYNNVKFGRIPLSDTAKKEYQYRDERGVYARRPCIDAVRGRHVYDVKLPNGQTLHDHWMISEEEFKKEDAAGLIHWPQNGGNPMRKIYLADAIKNGQIANDFWGSEYGNNKNATEEIKKLFNGVRVFDFPKPTKLLRNLLSLGVSLQDNPRGVVLDFFAGSGTTAHAVMQLNAEDGGHRKFIMVQLPEECSEKSEAYKAGYKTIDQLSRERIRRAAKKIKESDKNADDHDYGFRALYIDKANAKDDISVPADSLQQNQLSFQVDDIYADRSPLDLLFGVLVAKGWQLDGEIERRNINGNDVYLYDYVPGAGMVACFDNELTDEVINQIIDMHSQVAVFRETAFKQSDEKINLMERFKNDSSETRVWVI